MSNNVIEISRRVMFHEDEGMACGPCGMTAVDAEMVVNDSGRTVYLFAEWVDAVSDDFYTDATTESIYAIHAQINRNEGDFDANIEKRDRIHEAGIQSLFPGCDPEERYHRQFAALIADIRQELAKHDIDLDEDEDED